MQGRKLQILLFFASFKMTPALFALGTSFNFDIPTISEVLVILETELLDELVLDWFEFVHFHFQNADKLCGFIYRLNILKADLFKHIAIFLNSNQLIASVLDVLNIFCGMVWMVPPMNVFTNHKLSPWF